MIEWRFAELPEDGEMWLRHPTELQAYVDYRDAHEPTQQWRRVTVVTKEWLANHLSGVRFASTQPLWAGLPMMVVLPDARGDDLRRALTEAIQQDGIDLFSTPLD